MSLVTLSKSNKQTESLLGMNEESVNIFDQDAFEEQSPFSEFYFSNSKQDIKITDNLIQSDEYHNTLNILQQEMGYLISNPESAQDV